MYPACAFPVVPIYNLNGVAALVLNIPTRGSLELSKPLWVIRNFSAWVYEPDPALFVFWPHICFLAPQWAMLWRSFSILSFAKPQPARNAFKDLVWPHHDVGSPGHPCDEPGLRRLERSRPPASHPPILLVPLRPFFCCEPFFLVLFLLFRPDRCFFFLVGPAASRGVGVRHDWSLPQTNRNSEIPSQGRSCRQPCRGWVGGRGGFGQLLQRSPLLCPPSSPPPPVRLGFPRSASGWPPLCTSHGRECFGAV